MNRNVLLVGLKAIVVEDARKRITARDVSLFSATSLEEVRKVFDEQTIDSVIVGAGLDLETRMQIVRHVFEASDTTTVHLKDKASGPQGFLPFVNSVLSSKT